MKKTLILLVTAGLLILNPANSFSGSDDERSSKILRDLSKTYKTYKSIKASFTISIKNNQASTSVKQKGTLYQKGKKFRVNMSGQEIYCDGKTLWTYLQDANEVQISKFDDKLMDISPSEIFTIYEKGFEHRYGGKVGTGTNSLEVIELTPKDKDKSYFKVKLAVDQLANKIKEMSVYGKNGVVSTYIITAFEPNVDISDSYFKFDAKEKPGVIEIDLR